MAQKGSQDTARDERAEILARFVDIALDDAYGIRESMTELLERRKANREQLRGFAAQGHLTPEQIAEVNELYPLRERKAKGDPDEVAEETDESADPVGAEA